MSMHQVGTAPDVVNLTNRLFRNLPTRTGAPSIFQSTHPRGNVGGRRE